IWLRVPKAAVIAPLAFGVRDTAVAVARLVLGPAGEAFLLGRAEVLRQDGSVGPDMGVGIEDPVAVARHYLPPRWSPKYRRSSSCCFKSPSPSRGTSGLGNGRSRRLSTKSSHALVPRVWNSVMKSHSAAQVTAW